MASRSHRATSGPGGPGAGPGRDPASDGRFRATARPGTGRRRRTTDRAEAVAAARSRADALMAGGYGGRVARPGAGPESWAGDAGTVPAEPVSDPGGLPGPAPAGEPAPPPAPAPAAASAGAPVGRWAAAAFAVRERLPMWVQLRCGLEPKTLAALAVVLVAAAVFAGMHFRSARPEGVRAPETVGEAVHAPDPEEAEPTPDGGAGRPEPAPGAAPVAGPGGPIVVDVSGKVRSPGLRRLPSGSRVDDALKAAGGARPGTDLAGLNRARVLVDGEQIVVGAPPAPAAGATGPASAGGATGPVSLNTATAEQLEGLPGVGPVLAQHILDYRTQHGGFRSVDELREVTGIGARRFADLHPLVRP
ncbi:MULTISPECIES: ComEA family DNA-binding protein [unclassified Streptomyces]|uniref:ComEA family DNA-binding protein n=1 Tax=unclassified Streptomyces TaxID=2593676 RepID=UPI001F53F37C|nr:MULTISPECIES: ComEA family DNA-binding protein [unclassified Streptomyces]